MKGIHMTITTMAICGLLMGCQANLHESLKITEDEALNFYHISIGFDDVISVLQGVTEALNLQINVNQYAPCLDSPSAFQKHLADTARLILSRDGRQVQQGMNALGNALDYLPSALDKCQGEKDLIGLLRNMTMNLKDPISFYYLIAKNLSVNAVNVYPEVEAAIVSYVVQDWRTFGNNIGFVLQRIQQEGLNDIVTNSVASQPANKNLAEFYKEVSANARKHWIEKEKKLSADLANDNLSDPYYSENNIKYFSPDTNDAQKLIQAIKTK
eukprot:TRINITY_DN6028_c0_g1_i1.p1 TRINITY_DN6028_c0_g1~~TRINITY_DN6028_c0_g1_i1.p1  ORF type:complete len:270 (+),score=51.18 TRINITY_DN6028_c0_g1_i1:158-967(+)